MTPMQRRELNELAYNDAHLHALLKLLDRGMPEVDWWHYAVLTLAKAKADYFAAAVDAENRAMPKQLQLGKVS